MKNNIDFITNKTSSTFVQKITSHLQNNMDITLCHSIANLLAIDYINRLKSMPDLIKYINICIKRLKNHIGKEIVLDNDFAKAMTLFIIAITPESNDDKHEQTQEKSQNISIESIINAFFINLTVEEKENIRLILKDVLNEKHSKELINIISSNPKQFHKMVINTMARSSVQKEITQIVKHDLKQIANVTMNLNKKCSNIKTTIGQAVLVCTVFASASFGFVMGGIALPILLVPSVVGAVKCTSIISSKISDKIIASNTDIKKDRKILNKLTMFDKKQEINSANISKENNQITNKIQTTNKSKEQAKSIAKNVGINLSKADNNNQKNISSKQKIQKSKSR